MAVCPAPMLAPPDLTDDVADRLRVVGFQDGADGGPADPARKDSLLKGIPLAAWESSCG